ncbi:MAG: ribonuclease P protein component [Bacteroides sp.]|nr:ribonuclease P protein component [Bacteroides sp.]
MDRNTFRKTERLNSKILIEKMFSGGSKSFSIFPLRLVFMPLEIAASSPASVLISVPKKRFKKAVDRNRVKRQIREAYRKNKHDLIRVLLEKEMSIAVAFIYLSDEMVSTSVLENKIQILLAKVMEKLS